MQNGKNGKLLFALAYGLFFICAMPASAGGEQNGLGGPGSWEHKQEIVFNPELITGGEILKDFPVLITEKNISDEVFAQAKDKGCDIRFSRTGDDANPGEIPMELANFDKENKKAEIWVKADLDPKTKNSIWIWWGNHSAECYSATEKYGRQNVWRDEYKGVWHLDEISDGKNAVMRHDSTRHNNNLGDFNTVSSVPGVLGDGAFFDFKNREFLGIADKDQNELDFSSSTKISVSAWINMMGEGDSYGTIILSKLNSYMSNGMSYNFHTQPQHYPRGFSASISSTGDNIEQFYVWPGFSYDNWYNLHFTINSGVHKIYENGIPFERILRNPDSTGDCDMIYGTKADFIVGGQGDIDFVTNHWDGKMDEVRIYAGVLSDNWIAAENKNQANPGLFAKGQKVESRMGKGKDPVILIPGILGSAGPKGHYMLDPILHVYDNLWKAFKQAGYEENVNLFAFPYEWRDSNTHTAYLLKQKIDEIKNSRGVDKVDLVAHSMGGLVARQYIEGPNYGNDVDQMIFLATPHQGAPEAYLVWEGAEFGRSLQSLVAKRLFDLEAIENGYTGGYRVYNYLHKAPIASFKELLPVYDYLQDEGSSDFRHYPENYPANLFLEYLNKPAAKMKLDNMDVTNIVANNGDKTINSFVVEDYDGEKWEHGTPVDYVISNVGLIMGPGDGTVPAASNKGFAGEDIPFNSGHRDVVTDAQAAVLHELTGENYNILYDKKHKSTMLVRVMSPVDFLVSGPDGKRLGKDFENSSDVNEIEDAYYSGFESKEEYATILDPVKGKYGIRLEAVADGKYTVAVSYLEDGIEVDREYTGWLKNGQTINLDFDYDDAGKELSKISFSGFMGFEKVLNDLHELYKENDFSEEQSYRYLVDKVEKLKAHYEEMPKEKSGFKAFLDRNYVLFQLKIQKMHMEEDFEKSWMNEFAHGILEEDFTNLINML